MIGHHHTLHHGAPQGQQLHHEYNYYNASPMYSGGEEWAELVRVPPPPSNSNEDISCGAIAFDQCHEMVWIGYSDGRLTSYLLPTMEKYTSIISNQGEIIQLVPTYEGVVAISDQMAVFRSRGCVQHQVIAANHGHKITCGRLNTPDPHKPTDHLLLGVDSGLLHAYDLNGYRPLQPSWSLDFYNAVTVLASSEDSQLQCAGTFSGQLDFFDGGLRTNRIEASIPNAHSGSIISIDMMDNYIITCGVASRSINPYDRNAPVNVYPDPLVKLFDVRMAGVLNSVPFPSSCGLPPSFVKFHSSMHSFYACDAEGELILFDMTDPSQYYGQVCQLQSTVTTWDIAISGELMASGSQDGTVVVYDVGASATPHAILDPPESHLDFPPAQFHPPLTLSPLDPSPASRYLFRPSINNFGEETTPLSSWLPSSIEKSFMHNLTLVIAPKPTKVLLPEFEKKIQHRDTIGYTSHRGIENRNSFLYGKGKSIAFTTVDPRSMDSTKRQVIPRSTKSFDESDPCHVPAIYKYAEIKLSKHAMDGYVFDFSKHNRTPFVGLENSLPFAYMNAVLQLLYFTPGVRAKVLDHLCDSLNCVKCELGFLYHMMDETKAKAHEKNKSCQVTNFLSALHQVPHVADHGLFDKTLSILVRVERMFTFLMEAIGLTTLSHIDLNYDSVQSELPSFQEILDSSEAIPQLNKPEMISVGCGPSSWLNDSHIQHLWSLPQWLPSRIHLGGEEYGLVGVVSAVLRDPKKSHVISGPNAHLVTHICTDESTWYLFNDFSVSISTLDDAINFTPPWKWPNLLLYRLISLNESMHPKPVEKIEIPSSIFRSASLGKNATIPLSMPRNLPKRGERVAIDTEFVIVEMEEATLQTDGTRIVTKESRQSLARVSVIHGETEEVILDDYILPNEPIVDYLTRFSGLTAEDLDPALSRHHIVSLKTAYMKLRYLVDAGCLFVGHGLQKDFRIVNLFVPPDQILDTVELYQQPNMRKIALRFLSAYLLKADIQLDTHDSIEDARAALMLHNKYISLVAANEFHKTLMEIYAAGRLCRWKIADLQASS